MVDLMNNKDKKEMVVIEINNHPLAVTRYNCKTILLRIVESLRCDTCNDHRFKSYDDAEACRMHSIIKLRYALNELENYSNVDILVSKKEEQ